MSQLPINLSPDLIRLREDGYEVSIEHEHLVLQNIPYINANRQICRGTLVSDLDLSGNKTNPPKNHIAMFSGDYPCNQDGVPIENIRLNSTSRLIGEGLTIKHSFSSRPRGRTYVDYYEKMTTYAALISNPATAVDPSATPRTYRVIESADDSRFVYFDNASGRAGITAVTQKLKRHSVAIIGLGGTGSYLLDFVAKTPVKQIHLYDADVYEQHNAFRSPGAPSLEQLQSRPLKVDYFTELYSKMHKGVVPHTQFVTDKNVDELCDHEMVFVCIDNNVAKATIITALEKYDIPFIDVGMGLELVDDSLVGTIRTTTSIPGFRKHVHERDRISFKAAPEDNIYANNIQIAELNAANAFMAVLRWKKLWGFYKDTESEYHSLFTIDDNHLLNEGAT